MSVAAAAQSSPPAADEVDPLTDSESVSQFRTKLVWLARSRYRVTRDEADEIVQTTFTAYLQVRARYAHVADHGATVIGHEVAEIPAERNRVECIRHVAHEDVSVLGHKLTECPVHQLGTQRIAIEIAEREDAER